MARVAGGVTRHFGDALAAPATDRFDRDGLEERACEETGRGHQDAFASFPNIHATRPADYDMQIKHFYSRFRDTYERAEVIFCNTARRGVNVLQTQRQRMVHLSHAQAKRFHQRVMEANKPSHENPVTDTVPAPLPILFWGDLAFLETSIADLKADCHAAEAARKQAKPNNDVRVASD